MQTMLPPQMDLCLSSLWVSDEHLSDPSAGGVHASWGYPRAAADYQVPRRLWAVIASMYIGNIIIMKGLRRTFTAGLRDRKYGKVNPRNGTELISTKGRAWRI